MADQPTLKLHKPIPAQVVNEGAKFGPLMLTDFIEAGTPENKTYFRAELSNGQPLPKGLICTTEGVIDGIAADGTQGVYKVKVTAVNDEAEEFAAEFDFTIKSRITMNREDAQSEIIRTLKAEIWEALGKDLPAPEFKELLNRPITAVEVYHLLQRFATLTIWDVYNLDYPGKLVPLQLEGMSKHYNIYDRGCCLVGSPKDLFSHERTLEDALQTARVMAREVYNRGWVIEFAGFDKMVRSAWVELQILSDTLGKSLQILHYSPSPEDLRAYQKESEAKGPAPTI